MEIKFLNEDGQPFNKAGTKLRYATDIHSGYELQAAYIIPLPRTGDYMVMENISYEVIRVTIHPAMGCVYVRLKEDHVVTTKFWYNTKQGILGFINKLYLNRN